MGKLIHKLDRPQQSFCATLLFWLGEQLGHPEQQSEEIYTIPWDKGGGR